MRRNASFGNVDLEVLNLDAENAPTWNAFASFTLVLEVRGSVFLCSVEEVPGAEITATDSRFASGPVGIKTYQMSGAFEFLEVCPLP